MAMPISNLTLSVLCLKLTLLLAISIRSSGSPAAKAAAAFFVFGDSIVDPGNNNHIETLGELKANYPPYGHNGYFGEPTGRFNDGRTMVDFIADYANLPIIPPFLQPSANFTNGVNFASGGAGVLPETNRGLVVDFKTQLKQFKEVTSMLTTELGDTKSRELIAKAVYFISIGSNDYIASYIFDPEKHNAYPIDEFIGMVIGNFSQSIQELYEMGARKLYILSLSPLGCLPAFRAANPRADGGCFEDVSALAMAHNNAISGVLISLEHILKGFKYASSDLFNWLNETIHYPSKYGFKDGINACCGTGPYRGIYSCGGKKKESDYQVCENPEDHVWWDSIHATERIHELFAKLLWSDPLGKYSMEDLFFNSDEMKIGEIKDDREELEEFVYNHMV